MLIGVATVTSAPERSDEIKHRPGVIAQSQCQGKIGLRSQ